MALNMTAFVGGAASGIIDRIDDIERKAEKKDDRAYTKSEQNRLYNRAARDKKQAITDTLASQLAVYYPPEYVKDIMSNGNGAAQYAISQGEYYDKNNMDPALNYRLTGGASVAKPKEPKDTFQGGPLSGAVVTSVGDVSKSAEDSSSSITAPVGLGGDTFRNKFTPRKQTKTYNTLAAMQVGLLNERIAAGTNADLLADVDKRESLFLKQAAKVAEAERKKDDSPVDFFNPTQREALIKAERSQAQQLLEIQLDLAGQITSGIAGSNKASIADVRLVTKLTERNSTIYKEDKLAGEISSIANNTIVDLNTFAKKKLAKTEFGYQSQEELKAAVAAGTVTDGDIFAVKVNVTVPATESAAAYQIESFIGGTYIGENYYKAMGIKENGEFVAPNGFLYLPHAFDTSKIFKPFGTKTETDTTRQTVN